MEGEPHLSNNPLPFQGTGPSMVGPNGKKRGMGGGLIKNVLVERMRDGGNKGMGGDR